MGDRCVVIFKTGFPDNEQDPTTYSCGVYIHDLGGLKGLNELLGLASKMGGLRHGQPDNAIFGFAAACAAERIARVKRHQVKGSSADLISSLACTTYALVDSPTSAQVVKGFKGYFGEDAGTVVVDCKTGEVKAFAGYLAKETIPSVFMNDR